MMALQHVFVVYQCDNVTRKHARLSIVCFGQYEVGRGGAFMLQRGTKQLV